MCALSAANKCEGWGSVSGSLVVSEEVLCSVLPSTCPACSLVTYTGRGESKQWPTLTREPCMLGCSAYRYGCSTHTVRACYEYGYGRCVGHIV